MIPGTVMPAQYFRKSRLPILLLNATGILVGWNSAAEILFPELETANKSTLKKKLEDLISDISGGKIFDTTEFCLPESNLVVLYDFPDNRVLDNKRWRRLYAENQNDTGYFCIIEDITEQKNKESSLVAEKEEALKASTTRSQFLANMSHEIRTPIQTISGMVELLGDTPLNEEQTEYVRQVRFSADVMLTLINDILDISKAEAGQLKIEEIEFDLPDVIERTIDLISMEAHKKGLEVCIDISSDLPEQIIGDPVRFRQILLNLVKNAVKFTEKGLILITATPITTGTAQYILVEVADTGIGIKAEIKEKLFTQFFQADSSTTRKYGGTGLGLAISKNIVELMYGTIGVRDNTPAGSIFWFRLPLHVSPDFHSITRKPQRPETRFLVVDDNAQTRIILIKMLQSLGYSVIMDASSGKEALRTLHSARQPFDIVFIDMIMPEMDGWRLAAEINKNREINQAQLYLMVPEGSFGAEAKMKLLEWFNGYLYKPIKRHMLVDLLEEKSQSSIDLEVVEELESVEDDVPVTDQPDSYTDYTVLIAEDHPVNRKLLQMFLEKTGVNVITADDGQAAIEAIQNAPADIIFMDIQMPRMNGYEATDWLRKNGYAQPIIACTANAGKEEKKQCLDYGMTDVLPKPYKRQDAIDILHKYCMQKAIEKRQAKIDETNSDIFDATGFLDLLMGDTESARTLAAEFIAQTASHIECLAEDIDAGTMESVNETAHLIKGSSLNITAQRMADAALNIEKEATRNKTENLSAMLHRLRQEFDRLKKIMQQEGIIQ